MSLWIIFSLLVVAAGISVVAKLASGRKRRKHLVEAGRTASWEMVRNQAQRINRIVQTDFGYGREVWALDQASTDTDLELRAFQIGVLILPRPKASDLQEFCRTHHIPLTLMMIK